MTVAGFITVVDTTVPHWPGPDVGLGPIGLGTLGPCPIGLVHISLGLMGLDPRPWALGAGPGALMGTPELREFFKPFQPPYQPTPGAQDKSFREAPHLDKLGRDLM